MDSVALALVVMVGVSTLASLGYGFYRDAHRSDEVRQEERAQLRLDKLRLELQLEAAHAENVRLNRENERLRQEDPRSNSGINVSGGAVTIGRDAVGGTKEVSE
jgi:hypothetical protein